MTDQKKENKRRIPKLKISAWYILLLCIIATAQTKHFLSMYATVHWPLLTSSYKLKALSGSVLVDERARQIVQENESLEKFFDALPHVSEKIHTSGWKLMGQTCLYHVIGLISFLLAIFSFFCSPRWVGIIALPFGLYSMDMALIIM